MDKRLTLTMPGKDEPGFFKFLRGYAVFAEVMTKPASHTPADIDSAVDWLASLAKDKTNAKAILMEMSASEIGDLVKGMGEATAVEPDPLS